MSGETQRGQHAVGIKGPGRRSRRGAAKLVLIAAVLIAALVASSSAHAADVLFNGKLKGGGPVRFRLIDHGHKVQGWDWHDLAVRCREGHDTVSGRYSIEIPVNKDGHFRATDVPDREGFKTTLFGSVSQHHASGTLSMAGDDLRFTRCHGAMAWHTQGEKATVVYETGRSSVPGPFFELCTHKNPFIVGGGVKLDGPHVDLVDGGLLLNASSPADFSSLDEVSRWEGNAFNTGTGKASSMTVTAICTNDVGFESANAVTHIPPHSHKSLTVPCPGGTHVVSGGAIFDGSDQPHYLVGITRPADSNDPDSVTDDGWTVSGINNSADSAGMSVTARCAADDTFKYVHSGTTTVPFHAERSDRVPCPSHTHVTGGGVDLKGDRPNTVDSFPFDGHDSNPTPNNGWQATVFNDSVGPKNMKVFAICQPD